MQDIDFDEIDRAVNSITGTNTEMSSNITPITAPSSSPVVESVGEPVVPTPVSPSPAARRSSGRFMDVVHPSSDMRPTSNDRSSTPSAPSLHREEVPERNEVADRPEPVSTPSTAFHWPDPIDLAEQTPDLDSITPAVELSVAEPAPEVTEEPPVVTTVEDDDETEDASPLESPFLTDAKVEKRPLGAFSGADADLPLLEDPIPFSTNAAPRAEPVAPVEEHAHEEHEDTPHELHPTLLALDGHDLDEPLLEATNPPDPTPTQSADDTPSGPTSITQQYKEQPTTNTQQSGSIFDTEAYHQPLTHPAKKRSGILVIVWIIALILVGGGIGAAIYFVVLPMLK